jgi:mycothiol synthase
MLPTEITCKTFDQYLWRPARKADAPQMHALLLARDQVDGIDSAGTLEGMQREFEDTWLHEIEADTLLAETPEGEVAAFALVFANPQPTEKRMAYPWFEIHPEHRLPGIAEAVLEWAEARAIENLDRIPSDLPRVLGQFCDDKLQARIALYEKSGYETARYFYRMRRDLREPLDSPELQNGLVTQRYSPELDSALHQAFNDAFSDHWNFEPVAEGDWQMWFTGGEDFRPELSYLVMDGAEIAGFSINSVNPEKNRQRGINEGWINQLGTRRPWRKQGIATALLLASMQAFRAAGLEYATLGVDTENPTGALRIYERLGFEPVKRFIAYHKHLDDKPEGHAVNR